MGRLIRKRIIEETYEEPTDKKPDPLDEDWPDDESDDDDDEEDEETEPTKAPKRRSRK